ncbi:MAG: M23 family metallopeptidase [Elusimicrobia bacterium]|nr:M23 family metallopeptidase [Elusimicrobiota bacterium]
MTAALLLAAALAAPAAARPTLDVQGRAVRQGELLLVVVAGNSAKAAPSAEFRGRALGFFYAPSSGTWLAFLPLDVDASTGPAELAAVLREPGGRALRDSRTLDVAPGDFRVRRVSVPAASAPARTDAERVEDEDARLRDLFARGETPRLFRGSFAAPIRGARASGFGARRVVDGEPRAPNSAQDLRARAGTPVRAPADGRVVLAGRLFLSGLTVVLDHGQGLTTLYSHLSRVAVRSGQTVRKGRVIGRVGRSGRSRIPHLRWALRAGGARVDPYSLLALDLDAYLDPPPPDPLRMSPDCARKDLPPPPRWGRPLRGLRARVRALKPAYVPGERVSLLVELQNVGRRSAFIDFVRDPAARGIVLGFNRGPAPFSELASSATARLLTEQVRIPPRRVLCFEQDQDASGPLTARATTGYALTYGTGFLYSSATARPGLWRGTLTAPAAEVIVSTSAAAPPAP